MASVRQAQSKSVGAVGAAKVPQQREIEDVKLPRIVQRGKVEFDQMEKTADEIDC
jgi:hypothetical protein